MKTNKQLMLKDYLLNGGLVGRTFRTEEGKIYSIKNRPVDIYSNCHGTSIDIFFEVRYKDNSEDRDEDDSEDRIRLLGHLFDMEID